VAFEGLTRPLAEQCSPLLRALHAAAATRAPLFEHSDAVRLHDADAEADGLRGATVERYADFAVLNAYTQKVEEQRAAIAQALVNWGARGVYFKQRRKADLRYQERAEVAPELPLAGEAAPLDVEVVEHGLRFWVRLGQGLSTGLFIDQRDNRQLLVAGCRGSRVLNLFAYTCSFSVAAGAGGASQVTSIDLSAAALARGHQNLQLNGLPKEQHRLLRADAKKWLRRAAARPERFDWIVLDPPSFATVGSDTLKVDRDYAELVAQCLRLLAPKGQLLSVLNHRGTSPAEHKAQLLQVAQAEHKPVAKLQTLTAPADCVASGPAHTKSMLLSLG
jgi:23S rRNA (cytosine1962-C5)-methyltransferase